jgi:hypothetical protein
VTGFHGGLMFRVFRSDGVLLIEQDGRYRDQVSFMGSAAGDVAAAALADGYGVTLQVMDPDGEISPAGEWITVHEVKP